VKDTVTIDYRPVGGDFRRLELELAPNEAQTLFELLVEPERFVLGTVTLQKERCLGWFVKTRRCS